MGCLVLKLDRDAIQAVAVIHAAQEHPSCPPGHACMCLVCVGLRYSGTLMTLMNMVLQLTNHQGWI
jgi:hypothetical protein